MSHHSFNPVRKATKPKKTQKAETIRDCATQDFDMDIAVKKKRSKKPKALGPIDYMTPDRQDFSINCDASLNEVMLLGSIQAIRAIVDWLDSFETSEEAAAGLTPQTIFRFQTQIHDALVMMRLKREKKRK